MKRAVGQNVLRKEGAEKVTGAARYIDDLTFPNLLHARTIRSTIPCGDIVDVRYHLDAKAFTVVTHRDIPGRNVAEPILLLAHEDREALQAAPVEIVYRESTPNYDPEASSVTFKRITIEKGSLEQGFAAAAVIVDGEYRTGHQEQLYIETNGVIA